MKKVYICSACNSQGNKTVNVIKAQGYCDEAVLRGYVAIAPHAMYGNTINDDDPEEREKGLAAGMELLKICDEIWVFGPVAGGMINEIKMAGEMGITIRFMLKDGSSWIWPKA